MYVSVDGIIEVVSRTAEENGHRSHGAVPRSSLRHGTAQELLAVPPAGNRANGSDGRQHVLHDAEPPPLHHRHGQQGPRALHRGAVQSLSRRGLQAQQLGLPQVGHQLQPVADQRLARTCRLPLSRTQRAGRDLPGLVSDAREAERGTSAGRFRMHEDVFDRVPGREGICKLIRYDYFFV